jgi:hypothetical protein
MATVIVSIQKDVHQMRRDNEKRQNTERKIIGRRWTKH